MERRSIPTRLWSGTERAGAATPLGLARNLARPTQGSSLLATLGFETKSLWDSMGDDHITGGAMGIRSHSGANAECRMQNGRAKPPKAAFKRGMGQVHARHKPVASQGIAGG